MSVNAALCKTFRTSKDQVFCCVYIIYHLVYWKKQQISPNYEKYLVKKSYFPPKMTLKNEREIDSFEWNLFIRSEYGKFK